MSWIYENIFAVINQQLIPISIENCTVMARSYVKDIFFLPGSYLKLNLIFLSFLVDIETDLFSLSTSVAFNWSVKAHDFYSLTCIRCFADNLASLLAATSKKQKNSVFICTFGRNELDEVDPAVFISTWRCRIGPVRLQSLIGARFESWYLFILCKSGCLLSAIKFRCQIWYHFQVSERKSKTSGLRCFFEYFSITLDFC